MLWSVYHEYQLVPAWARKWNPAREALLPAWVQWQIFTPIALLQIVNILCVRRSQAVLTLQLVYADSCVRTTDRPQTC